MPMPPPYEPRHARPPLRCQHCERDIEWRPSTPIERPGGWWVDREDVAVCEGGDHIYHTPMPVIT
jgi:hypothetical protein